MFIDSASSIYLTKENKSLSNKYKFLENIEIRLSSFYEKYLLNNKFPGKSIDTQIEKLYSFEDLLVV